MNNQKVNINVNLSNFNAEENMPLVNNKDKELPGEFTTLRLLKKDLNSLRNLCTVLGYQSTYSYKILDDVIESYVSNSLNDEQKLMYKLLNK